MSALDAFNVCVRRYMMRTRFKWSPNLQDVNLSDFKPSQSTSVIAAQLWGKADGTWYFVTITVDRADLVFKYPATRLFELVEERIKAAVNKLNELAEDPFDRWVREVRKANGKDTETADDCG